MDDLKLLSEMRADAPEPDAARLQALRRRYEDGRRPKPARRRLWLVPSVLAAATATAAVIVAVNGAAPYALQPGVTVHTGPAQITPVKAETVLGQAALAAERREPDGTPRPDQWIYRKVAVKQPDEDTSVLQEYWTRYDGTRQASRQDQGTMETHTTKPDPDDDDLTPQEYAAKLARLPTDPGKLLDHVRGDRHWMIKPEDDPGGVEHPDARAFRVLSVYLEADVAMSPEIEAAIFRALAKIPGVRVDMGVRDAANRAGIGIAYDSATQRDEEGRLVSRSYVVLDGATYRFLGRRVDNLQDDVLDGEVLARKGTFYATAELAGGIVDEPGQVP